MTEQQQLINQTWVHLHKVKPIYWHWVVVKESVLFFTRPNKESGTASGQKDQSSQWVSAKHFWRPGEVGHPRVCDQLVYSSLIRWWWSGGVVSQGFTLSVLRLQEAWGCMPLVKSYICHLVGWEGAHICKIPQEMCIRYYQHDLGASERS